MANRVSTSDGDCMRMWNYTNFIAGTYLESIFLRPKMYNKLTQSHIPPLIGKRFLKSPPPDVMCQVLLNGESLKKSFPLITPCEYLFDRTLLLSICYWNIDKHKRPTSFASQPVVAIKCLQFVFVFTSVLHEYLVWQFYSIFKAIKCSSHFLFQ